MRVAAVVLAAGLSRRMGAANKLQTLIDGIPLVRRAVEAAACSGAMSVTVVLGHDAGAVEQALVGLDVRKVRNERYADGISTSIAAGVAALDRESDAVVILLGDMPYITSGVIDGLISRAVAGHIVVPTFNGQRGNPVLWPRKYFRDLLTLDGDLGARTLFKRYAHDIVQTEIGAAALIDIDTPQDVPVPQTQLAPR
jgi:molybdenum cofactor cytidylyltransferase